MFIIHALFEVLLFQMECIEKKKSQVFLAICKLICVKKRKKTHFLYMLCQLSMSISHPFFRETATSKQFVRCLMKYFVALNIALCLKECRPDIYVGVVHSISLHIYIQKDISAPRLLLQAYFTLCSRMRYRST